MPTYNECSGYLLAMGKLAIEESLQTAIGRGNQRQIGNLTNEGAEGSREVHVAAGNDRIQLDTPLPNVTDIVKRQSLGLLPADDGRGEPVAVTGRSKRELSIEESQPSTIGEANQRRRRRKTGSACGRYWPVKEGVVDGGEPTMDDWRS
nr:unnamed protein product [Spirometra erinaceieuropaei]